MTTRCSNSLTSTSTASRRGVANSSRVRNRLSAHWRTSTLARAGAEEQPGERRHAHRRERGHRTAARGSRASAASSACADSQSGRPRSTTSATKPVSDGAERERAPRQLGIDVGPRHDRRDDLHAGRRLDARRSRARSRPPRHRQRSRVGAVMRSVRRHRRGSSEPHVDRCADRIVIVRLALDEAEALVERARLRHPLAACRA